MCSYFNKSQLHEEHYISESESSSEEETLQQNNHIGSELTPKQNSSIRIFFQNVNSIDTDREGGDFSTICKDVILTGTDVLMLAEPNLCHLHNKV